MRKHLFFIAALLICLSSATVSGDSKNDRIDYENTKRYRYAQPIMFVERGVEFMIFPDGSFEFNDLEYRDYRTAQREPRMNFRNVRTSPSRASKVNFLERSPRTQIYYNRFGDVAQINNISIDYDRTGRIKRVGSVMMGYQKGQGRLKSVGKLRVNYNSWGEIVHIRGHVNRFNSQYNYDSYLGHSKYFDCDDYDDDYYYYEKDGKRKKHKKRNKLKR